MDPDRPPALNPTRFEILVTRELRKIGFSLDRPRRLRLEPLASADDYVLELRTALHAPGADALTALISCRSAADPVDDALLSAVLDRMRAVEAPAALVFATAGFRAGTVRTAARHPVALFRVSEGRKVFDTGGWGAPGHYPAWLPEHVAELAAPGPGLEPRYEMTAQGQAPRVLERLRPRGDLPEAGLPGAGAEGPRAGE